MNLLRNAAVQVILAAAFLCTASAVSIEELGWLSGCWQSDGDNRQVREQWMKPAGNMMLGMSHTVANGKTREYEFIRIVQEENGDVFFVANPSGQKEARFKLMIVTEREARFENPEHDFPQRIIYRRDGDSLVGRIEGVSKGKERAADFPYKRVACD
ncbi:MAG TPA: DUF6265 family protein [Chthoniobacterales bacterium]|nr:DUF6265 family protein [Chthoniobacterales bacterium]